MVQVAGPVTGRVMGPVAAAAVLLAACGGAAVGPGGAPDTASPSVTSPAPNPPPTRPPATTSAPSPAVTTIAPTVLRSRALALDLPRTVVYADLAVALQAVTVSNATPATFLGDDPEPGPVTYGFVDLDVTHRLGAPGGELTLDMLTLIRADTTVTDAVAVDFAERLVVRPDVGNPWTVAFPVASEDDLDGAVLAVAAAGRVPARLPLTGDLPPPAYPVDVAATGSGTIALQGGCTDAVATFELLGVVLDVDAGADRSGEPIRPDATSRAAIGERWLRATVAVVAQEGNCGGTLASDDAFALLIDGTTTLPANRDVEQLADGQRAEFVWGWVVPIDAELVLRVGVASGATVDVPLAVPDDLPDADV